MLYSSPLIYSEQLAKQLYQATEAGDIHEVTTLLEQGANPNHRLYWSNVWNKWPPLHEACSSGNLKIVNLLVTSGGAYKNRGHGILKQTPLHLACCGGDIDTIMYLIQELQCDVGECVDYLYQMLIHVLPV